MGGTPVTSGYYKYTDIFFEWHKALTNQEDVGPLRATLSSHALIHPDHPLHQPGQDGIELYIVTRKNTNQKRLAFSYKQIEYIQYWLYATGLTKDRIPLPHSDHLIRGDEVHPPARKRYNNFEELKKANKVIEKSSKRLQGSDSPQQTRSVTFECTRTLMQAKKGTWLAIDFEAWEFEHDLLTEFGYSLIRWEDGELKEEKGHWVVKEHLQYHNGQFVADKRDHYDFGTSEVMPKAVFKDRINGLIDKYSSEGPLYLVFHDANGDIKYLQSKMIKAPLTDLSFTLPDKPPERGLLVVDTSVLFAALEGKNDKRGLKSMTMLLDVHLNVPFTNMHNAGNDAHLTMLCLRSMAEGDSIEYQRNKRWPGQESKTTSSVEFTPWDDPDLEDEPFIEDIPFLDDDRSWPDY